ncbi:MAG TPA: ComF family protein [Gammaproteobacteria bacterium]
MPEPFNDFSFRLLPGCCLLCGRRSRRERDICDHCERELPRIEYGCLRCARPLLSTHRAVCGDCLTNPPVQDRGRAAFRYAWPLDTLIRRFKFNGDHAAGRVLGELFAETLHAETPPPACLLPVPLHSRRLRERGFNQSEFLAKAVAAKLGIGLCNDLVERVRATDTQSGMDAIARRRNVRNAFALRGGRKPLPHVAILDDVVTTGSTTAEIARLLRRNGVERIEVWALARAV